MAPSSTLGRAGRTRIMLTTLLAVAAVALFLAPTSAVAASGSHVSISESLARTAAATASVASGTPAAVLRASSDATSRTSSFGPSEGLTPHVASVSERSMETPQAGLPAGAYATTNPFSAHGAPLTGTIAVSHTTNVAALVPTGETSALSSAPYATTFLAGWNGTNGTDSGCECYPPDSSIAVGPTAIGEVTNGQFFFYNRAAIVLENFSADAFWDAGTDFIITPYILYDNFTGRWITSASDESADTWMIAVSDTSNPLGDWEQYEGIPAPSEEYPYYPTIGTSEFMVGVGLDDYNETTGDYQSNLWVLNYTELQAGEETSYDNWNSADGWDFVPNFVATQGLTQSPSQYFAVVNPIGYYDTWNVTDAPPGMTTFVETDMETTGPYAAPEDVEQYGTGDTLYGGTPQAIDSSYQQNGLVSSVWDAYNGEEDAVRVDQGWPSNGTLWQDLEVYLDGTDLIVPAMAMDSRGDLTIISTFGSSSYYPGMFAFGQSAGEPYTVANGYGAPMYSSSYTTNADWGLYAGGAIDPTSSVAYLVGEYVGTDPLWNTWIVALQTDPVTVTVSSTPSGATDVGLAATFNATAYGGEGTYSYNWTALPPGCTNSEAAGVACTPSTVGTYTVSVNASDAYPQNASASLSFAVNPLPTVGAITASKSGADVGQTVTFTSATPSGGTPGFTYAWSGLPAGCGAPTGVSVQCTFTTSGALSLGVTVTDSVGGTGASPAFSYTVSPTLTIGAPTAAPSSGTTGSSFKLTVTASGGSGGDSYAWAGLPTGCTTSNAASITCVPSKAGSYNVTATVTDSNGASATSTAVEITVSTAPSTGFLGLSGDTGYLLLGVIAAVIVILLAVLLTRRKKPAPAPQAWQGGGAAGTGAPPAGASGGVPPGAGGGAPPPPPPPS